MVSKTLEHENRRGRPLVIQWRETPAVLQELYRKETNPHRRLRLRAFMHLRQGGTLRAISETLGIGYRTLQAWVRWYRAGGIHEVLKRTPGHNAPGRPARLSTAQLADLRRRAHQSPFASIEEAVEWVSAEWGIEYTVKGMYALCERKQIQCTEGIRSA